MGIRNLLFYYLALFKSLNMQRSVNLLLVESSYRISRLLRTPWVAGKPWSASIEPTTSCNLRCPECPTGMQTLTRAKGNLNLDHFNTILGRLAPNLFYLTLYYQGEPMLNPHFSAMVQSARSRRIFVATSTNGHFLNDEKVAEVIKSGLNHLIISLDGMDQETYEKYRVNGNIQTVTEGIQRLVAARKKLKSRTPFIELQFIVMRHNQHQVEQMRMYARQSGVDRVSFKSAQVYNFEAGNIIIPTIMEKSRYRQTPGGSWVISANIRNRCHRIWSSIVITWDGKVVPCCYDKDADHLMGNLLEEPLSAIWKNRQYKIGRAHV